MLTLRPDYVYVSDKLNEMEDHLLYDRIVNEIDVKYDAERYLQKYGSSGLYFNQVRNVLGRKYEEQAIRIPGQVNKLIELYTLYEMNLSAKSVPIAVEIALSARDSAKKAEEIKDWPQVVHYDEIALKYEKKTELQDISRQRIVRAQKKLERAFTLQLDMCTIHKCLWAYMLVG